MPLGVRSKCWVQHNRESTLAQVQFSSGIIKLLLTLAMKTDVSMIDLMCFNQPLFSSPDRNEDIDGFFNSHTEEEECLFHNLANKCGRITHYKT